MCLFYFILVKIRSTERQHDPVEGILLKAIKNVESVFTNRKGNCTIVFK